MEDNVFTIKFIIKMLEGEIILVKLKQNQITKRRIAEALAESFVDDPLYKHMIPKDNTRREALEVFFKIYLGIYSKYGDTVATSDELCSLAYIFYPERKIKKSVFVKDCIKGFLAFGDFFKYISFEQIVHMLKVIVWMSTPWVNKVTNQPYIRLSIIAVKPNHRGQGKSKQILHYVMNEANNQNKLLILETQNIENIAYYEHFGFELKHTKTYGEITQYCMIRQPEAK